MKWSRRNILLSVIILVHLIGFAYQTIYQHIYLGDSHEYLLMADNILDHHLFYCGNPEEDMDLTKLSKRPPVYPLFIALIKMVTPSDTAIIFIQNLLSIFNILLLLSILKRWKRGSESTALILILLCPAQVIYANFAMSEMLLQTFLLLLFSFTDQFLRKGNLKYGLWASLILILAMLTKPVMYPFSLIWLVAGVFYFFRKGRKWVILISLLPIIAAVLYSYWNFERTGHFHFSAITNINLVDYNTYFFLSNAHGAETADSLVNEIYLEADRTENFADRQAALKESALDIIRQSPVSYAIFHLKGALRGFIDPGRFDLFNFFGMEGQTHEGLLYVLNEKGFWAALKVLFNQSLALLMVLMLVFVANVIIALALLFLPLVKGLSKTQISLLLILPVYAAMATGPLNASRFMLPVMPFIVMGASISLSYWYQKLRGSKGSG